MLYKRKILYIAIVVVIAYGFCLAIYPNENKIVNNNENELFTTTTTTPTPFDVLKQWNFNVHQNITIEKYDALKVHTSIMKKKIMRMTQGFSKKLINKLDEKNIIVNYNVHMLYSDHIKKVVVAKDNKLLNSSSNNASNVLEENVKTAHRSGAGVLFIEYPYISMSQHLQATDDILKTFFEFAQRYNLKISLVIKDYYERSIENVKRNIITFLKTYGNHTSLYRHKNLPVFYVMDSFTISYEKWKVMLSPSGTSTIRNSEFDAVILGHIRDEEHSIHVRRSYFDGFFTSCNNNGDTFGSTWKNWQSLSLWAQSHDLVWSICVIEGTGKTLTMRAALNTILRCVPPPTFVFLSQINFDNDIIELAQRWTKIWSNSSLHNKHFLY